jgi:hypothetical protein
MLFAEIIGFYSENPTLGKINYVFNGETGGAYVVLQRRDGEAWCAVQGEGAILITVRPLLSVALGTVKRSVEWSRSSVSAHNLPRLSFAGGSCTSVLQPGFCSLRMHNQLLFLPRLTFEGVLQGSIADTRRSETSIGYTCLPSMAQHVSRVLRPRIHEPNSCSTVFLQKLTVIHLLRKLAVFSVTMWAEPRWASKESRFSSQLGQKILLFTTASRRAPDCTHARIRRVPTALSRRIKWPEHEADHSTQYSSEVKDGWSFTSVLHTSP